MASDLKKYTVGCRVNGVIEIYHAEDTDACSAAMQVAKEVKRDGLRAHPVLVRVK